MMEAQMAPKHYSYSNIEPYWLAVDWRLGTEMHNILKYVCRRHTKETFEINQEKWRDYLKFAVNRGGDLMVGPMPKVYEIKPWHVELAWDIKEGTEEHDILWAVWDCAKNGGDVSFLQNVFKTYCVTE